LHPNQGSQKIPEEGRFWGWGTGGKNKNEKGGKVIFSGGLDSLNRGKRIWATEKKAGRVV